MALPPEDIATVNMPKGTVNPKCTMRAGASAPAGCCGHRRLHQGSANTYRLTSRVRMRL
jgi:hypothetical protein